VLDAHGPVVAPADTPPCAWAAALPRRSLPLVLAPGTARGWFGGTPVAAWAPARVHDPSTLEAAGDALEATMAGRGQCLTCAVLSYEGGSTLVEYRGGVVLGPEGWRAWGDMPGREAARSASLARRAAADPVPSPDAPLVAGWSPECSEGLFRARVEETRRRIAAGDVYVLNLTFRLSGRPAYGPAATFRSLVSRTSADMAAFVVGPRSWIASASPERFLRIETACGEREAQVWPIKGTAPRGATARHDRESAQSLSGSLKERAEHVMVVDLERNDLGRVAKAGTVRVDPLFEVFATPYCHQLVSCVRATLRADVDVTAVLESAFPCGSVTGAPKRAAMVIAAELEDSPRGAYCGALLAAVPGEIDSSVLIRTAEGNGREVRWGTGCGITWDSDPAAEWAEAVLKTSPLVGLDGWQGPGEPQGVSQVACRDASRVIDS
jgi:para-aminobenzoate synthetase component 1